MRDRYTITERLDHGGMAEVFRGVAESMEGFKKKVAIKRILPNLTKNQKFVSMFLDEARLSLFLQHANIVQVFDISKTPDNAYFLVMEFVDGCNLKALIERQKQKGTRIEIAHAIYIMIECCKALQLRAHARAPRDRRAARHRPPRHLAAEHPAVEERRGEARGLRPREGEQPDRVDRPGRREGQVQLPVARGGERRSRSTTAPTCSRSASSCGRCSPAGACSTATPTTRPSSWCARRACRRSPRSIPRSSPSSRRSCARRSRAIPTIATRTPPTSATRSRSTCSRAA